MTAFVDANVIMYAGGTEHPFRAACVRVIDGVADGSLSAVTSVEVVQEIVHRYVSIKRPEGAIALAERTLDLFAPVLPVTHAMMRRVPDLTRRYPGLSARDIVHIATCVHEGLEAIVSTDTGFDDVREIRRIAPEDFARPS